MEWTGKLLVQRGAILLLLLFWPTVARSLEIFEGKQESCISRGMFRGHIERDTGVWFVTSGLAEQRWILATDLSLELWLQEALSVWSWVGWLSRVSVSSPLTEGGVTPPAVGLWPWAETPFSTGLRRAACHVCKASLGLRLLLIRDSFLQFTDPHFQSCFQQTWEIIHRSLLGKWFGAPCRAPGSSHMHRPFPHLEAAACL